MFPEIPWRDVLLNAGLSTCCTADSLHLVFGNRTEINALFVSAKQLHPSTPKHPFMQGEMFLLAASHLLASSVSLRIPEENLQDYRKPT